MPNTVAKEINIRNKERIKEAAAAFKKYIGQKEFSYNPDIAFFIVHYPGRKAVILRNEDSRFARYLWALSELLCVGSPGGREEIFLATRWKKKQLLKYLLSKNDFNEDLLTALLAQSVQAMIAARKKFAKGFVDEKAFCGMSITALSNQEMREAQEQNLEGSH